VNKPVLDSIRLFDLVRFQRHQLHTEGLITDDELAALVSGSPGAVARLESYDEIRARLAQAKADIAFLVSKVLWLRPHLSEETLETVAEIQRRWGCQ
jgi:hypothetical protein